MMNVRCWNLFPAGAGQLPAESGQGIVHRHRPASGANLVARGFEVFLDLKFHDIPNTVASACKVAADLGACGWWTCTPAAAGA